MYWFCIFVHETLERLNYGKWHRAHHHDRSALFIFVIIRYKCLQRLLRLIAISPLVIKTPFSRQGHQASLSCLLALWIFITSRETQSVLWMSLQLVLENWRKLIVLFCLFVIDFYSPVIWWINWINHKFHLTTADCLNLKVNSNYVYEQAKKNHAMAWNMQYNVII